MLMTMLTWLIVMSRFSMNSQANCKCHHILANVTRSHISSKKSKVYHIVWAHTLISPECGCFCHKFHSHLQSMTKKHEKIPLKTGQKTGFLTKLTLTTSSSLSTRWVWAAITNLSQNPSLVVFRCHHKVFFTSDFSFPSQSFPSLVVFHFTLS